MRVYKAVLRKENTNENTTMGLSFFVFLFFFFFFLLRNYGFELEVYIRSSNVFNSLCIYFYCQVCFILFQAKEIFFTVDRTVQPLSEAIKAF